MLLITCPFGLSSLLTREIKHLGMEPIDVFPTGCWINTQKRQDIISLNLSLRIANKVYLQIGQGSAQTFDELFECVHQVERSHFFKEKTPFSITAISKDSQLHAPRTIQAITHKAIATRLTGSNEKQRETDNHDPIEILTRIVDNQATILLNTSGDSLHKRGRRITQGDAPIKENLAIATLLQASRSFGQPLWDPCCGSGTLVIEAARFARNVLCGKQRRFDFQRLATYSKDGYERIRSKLVDKEIVDKTRTIIGSDVDPIMVEKAQRNAKQAGVADIVTFVEHDILSPTLPVGLDKARPTTIISNPPYGDRLQSDSVDDIHLRLGQLTQYSGRNGAIITGYDKAKNHFPGYEFKVKETRNGPDKVKIYYRKRFK